MELEKLSRASIKNVDVIRPIYDLYVSKGAINTAFNELKKVKKEQPEAVEVWTVLENNIIDECYRRPDISRFRNYKSALDCAHDIVYGLNIDGNNNVISSEKTIDESLYDILLDFKAIDSILTYGIDFEDLSYSSREAYNSQKSLFAKSFGIGNKDRQIYLQQLTLKFYDAASEAQMYFEQDLGYGRGR